jgi:hypothetical protein
MQDSNIIYSQLGRNKTFSIRRAAASNTVAAKQIDGQR